VTPCHASDNIPHRITNTRIVAISRAVENIHRCEDEMRHGNLNLGGPWLGYMDWLEELHCLIHAEDSSA
jgi:hypothetical protein